MKSSGEWALAWANGMAWNDIIAEVRAETLAWYRNVPWVDTEPQNEAAAPYVEPGAWTDGSVR